MSQIDETKKAFERMQNFDVSLLPRSGDLGQELSFSAAVEPAKRLIELYSRISLSALDDFPESELNGLENHANADYNHFKNIIDFKVQGTPNPDQVRDQYVKAIENRYAPSFQKLKDIISYSACRTTDFRLIEHEARGVFQKIEDKSEEVTRQLEQSKEQAESILEEIRKVAAEQGVSQQAIYFKEEHVFHDNEAKKWLKYTLIMACILAGISLLFVLASKWDWLSPKDNYEALQLIASKVFIYATLSYLLYLAGKNFLSHKHNAVLNKHRQNALMTFKAISDAGNTQECKEIILAQASYCMFNPQETGYIKVVSGDGRMKTFLESIPKTTVKIDS
ncbi:hypothetical protein [Desulfonatronum lacustre]|uniref:hypothetical protein n=1 Tax=Desulfonatronum lacustre TaxID=66849 RepID=UPI0004AD3863|nr:hypothetical protein [Desulfonatronum lacustre]